MSISRTLILETSSRTGQVALGRGEKIVQARRLDEARRHARDLAPAIRDLLAAEGWKPDDIDAVIVSLGPGSYTGLRVGLISAKTFAYTTGCALLGIHTFAALAAQTPADVAALDVFADAQQDRVYHQQYRREGGDWRPVSELTIMPFADWLAHPDRADCVTGPGLRGKEQRLPGSVQLLPAELWLPQPATLLRIGLQRFYAGQRDDLWTIEPLYLRPSAAEQQYGTVSDSKLS